MADTIWLADATATAAAGARLAEMVAPGDVIALRGTLGAGKTTFARGLLAALGLVGDAPSPTFAIVQPYEPPDIRIPVLHVDLYRIEAPAELDELGLDEARHFAVLVIEWPERAPGRWPDALQLNIATMDTGRQLTASVPPAWERRWPFP